MPCMCWYEPPEASKRRIKSLCQQLVDESNEIEREGDPYGFQWRDILELLDHLRHPHKCKEKGKHDSTIVS